MLLLPRLAIVSMIQNEVRFGWTNNARITSLEFPSCKFSRLTYFKCVIELNKQIKINLKSDTRVIIDLNS